jgi:glyoxylase-like metal-dependent hydrolase (beta-lactamase superfamily II)
MQLEDHLGDIVRKARKMNDVSPSAAASAAGISESELAKLESSGHVGQKLNFTAVAELIGVNAKKLQDLAEGWLPVTRKIHAWRELRMFSTSVEDLTVNAYLVWDGVTREAALFDTGVDAAPVLECAKANGLRLCHIFITHSHWDHVEVLSQIRAAFPEAQIHSNIKAAPKSQRLQPGDSFSLGSLQITHRETPGHAEDGVTYLINGWPGDAPQVAVVGDTIFAGSMGSGNGQWELARRKIREEILSLAPDTLICPGHGPLTTVGEERAHNPFF